MLKKTAIVRDENLEPLENPGQVSGFSSPAEDYKESRLHVIQKLVTDPTNTFYFKADSHELSEFGIHLGAIIIVDRTLKIKEGKIVVANHESQWLIRMLSKENNKMVLITAVENSKPIVVDENTVFFGVVTWCCNPLSEIKHL